jgi:putative oxidoreductase
MMREANTTYSVMTHKYLCLLFRLILGGVLVYAGWIKLFDTPAFMQDIANYRILPPALLPIVAITLPAIEIVAGVCLMIGLLMDGALVITTGLIVVFIAAVSSAIWRGLDVQCGCFGTSDAEKVSWTILMRDYVMLLIAVPLWLTKEKFMQLDTLLFKNRKPFSS